MQFCTQFAINTNLIQIQRSKFATHLLNLKNFEKLRKSIFCSSVTKLKWKSQHFTTGSSYIELQRELKPFTRFFGVQQCQRVQLKNNYNNNELVEYRLGKQQTQFPDDTAGFGNRDPRHSIRRHSFNPELYPMS